MPALEKNLFWNMLHFCNVFFNRSGGKDKYGQKQS